MEGSGNEISAVMNRDSSINRRRPEGWSRGGSFQQNESCVSLEVIGDIQLPGSFPEHV